MSEHYFPERQLRGELLLDALGNAWVDKQNADRTYERLLEQAVVEGLIQPQEAVVD